MSDAPRLNVVEFPRGQTETPHQDHVDFGGPSGPSGGGSDVLERVARLESDVDYIKRDLAEVRTDLKAFRQEAQTELKEIRAEMRTDFRIIFGALIAAVLGLAGLMAKGFHWL